MLKNSNSTSWKTSYLHYKDKPEDVCGNNGSLFSEVMRTVNIFC